MQIARGTADSLISRFVFRSEKREREGGRLCEGSIGACPIERTTCMRAATSRTSHYAHVHDNQMINLLSPSYTGSPSYPMRPIGQCEGRALDSARLVRGTVGRYMYIRDRGKVSILHRTSNAVARSRTSLFDRARHSPSERTLLYVMYIIVHQIKSPCATDKRAPARVLHATVYTVVLELVFVFVVLSFLPFIGAEMRDVP